MQGITANSARGMRLSRCRVGFGSPAGAAPAPRRTPLIQPALHARSRAHRAAREEACAPEPIASSALLWLRSSDKHTGAAELALVATACLLATSLASPAPAGAEVVDHLEAVKAAPLYDIAEGEDFLTNVARYGRFFVTVMLGTANVMLAPLGRAFKNPLSAILAVGSLAGTFYLGNVVLKAMLGIEPPEEIGQFNF